MRVGQDGGTRCPVSMRASARASAAQPPASHHHSRRVAITAAAASLLAPRPAPAASSPFCGAVDVVPPWAYSVQWQERALDGGVWARVLGDLPGSRGGVLGRLGLGSPPVTSRPVLVLGDPLIGIEYLESLELLASNRGVAFFDWPGVGRSKGRGGEGDGGEDALPSTPDTLAATIDLVRQGLGLGACHAVGVGLGGLLLLAALADPASPLSTSTLSLGLISVAATPAALVDGRRERAAQVVGRAAADALDADALARFRAAAICKRPAGCVAAALADGAGGALAARLAGSAPLVHVGGALAGWAPELRQTMPRTLLLTGEDGCVRRADAEALVAALGPAAEWRPVPASGDFVHVDAAAETVDAFELMFREVEVAGGGGGV
jgi:pimeloyl-ACP methyl ester carboxylesterase